MKNPLDVLFENEFYQGSASHFEQHRKQQILAGFTEYGKTYDPSQFTAEEQMNHFMSELPDILHYGYGMYLTILRLEKENADLKRELERREMWKNG